MTVTLYVGQYSTRIYDVWGHSRAIPAGIYVIKLSNGTAAGVYVLNLTVRCPVVPAVWLVYVAYGVQSTGTSNQTPVIR